MKLATSPIRFPEWSPPSVFFNRRRRLRKPDQSSEVKSNERGFGQNNQCQQNLSWPRHRIVFVTTVYRPLESGTRLPHRRASKNSCRTGRKVRRAYHGCGQGGRTRKEDRRDLNIVDFPPLCILDGSTDLFPVAPRFPSFRHSPHPRYDGCVMAIDLNSKPRLAPGCRLGENNNQRVLLMPERALRLNGPSLEIVTRCDGNHTVGQIIADLQKLYSKAEPHKVESDILGYLELLQKDRALDFPA